MATAVNKKAPITSAKKMNAPAPKKASAAKSSGKSPPSDDSAAKAASLKEKKAAEKAAKKARDEKDLITYETTKVLVPMWFGFDSVDKAFRKNRSLPPEAALCLMLVGSGTNGQMSEVGMQMQLRPSGFDRQEAQLLAMMGTSSLVGAKLAKRKIGKKYEGTQAPLIPNVLTAKGQKLYELVKRSVLATKPKSLGF